MIKGLTVVAVIMLAGGSPAERIVLQYWEKWTGDEAQAMQEVVDSFNVSQDRIRVEMTMVSQIDQKLLLAVLSKNPPDVAGLWASFVAPYAERGLINPLGNLVRKNNFAMDRFAEPYLAMCEHRGEVWALPSSALTIMLYWNPNHFTAAGLDPASPPKTFDELERLNEILTMVEVPRDGRAETVSFSSLTASERAEKKYHIVRFGFDPTMGFFWIPYWSYWFGGTIVDEDGRTLMHEPAMDQALDWYKAFFDKYGLAQVRSFGSSYGGNASSSNPFFSGRASMVLNGPWLPRFAEEYAPGLSWNVDEFPTLGNGKTLVDSDVLVIPRGTSYEKEAFEFIAYVNRSEVSERLNVRQSKMVPFKTVSENYIEKHPNRAIGRFHQVVDEGRGRPIPQTSLFSRLVSDLYTTYDLVSSNPEGAAVFLGETQKRLDQKFDRNEKKWQARKELLLKTGDIR